MTGTMCVNKSQFVPVISEPPCTLQEPYNVEYLECKFYLIIMLQKINICTQIIQNNTIINAPTAVHCHNYGESSDTTAGQMRQLLYKNQTNSSNISGINKQL